MKHSFIQLQISREIIDPENSNDFKRVSYYLLSDFWDMALFGEGRPTMTYFEKPEIMSKDEVKERLHITRSRICGKGANEHVSPSLSWHATSFCTKWLWNVEFNKHDKGHINKELDKLTMKSSH
ncbi:hypothetical protein O181_026044 [Austropuccinia psidii MF-1]|uniref:Uncharacterized protein n=1 Tax=Austropuccinia psidii MF-1 TaxID=1389203 RepID=A0A9Q3CJ80_9BASI|nr:hypothetical protein [Austropuccinia psidii MF-1]